MPFVGLLVVGAFIAEFSGSWMHEPVEETAQRLQRELYRRAQAHIDCRVKVVELLNSIERLAALQGQLQKQQNACMARHCDPQPAIAVLQCEMLQLFVEVKHAAEQQELAQQQLCAANDRCAEANKSTRWMRGSRQSSRSMCSACASSS